MARVNIVPKSRKPVTCSRCSTTIPVGSSYRWIKPRYGSKRIRCMGHACRFRPTDFSSAKVAAIHETIEDAETSIAAATCLDDIQVALSDVASVAEDVAQEYQDASNNWAGGNGNEEFQEKADACSEFASELEGWSPSGEDDEETVKANCAESNPREGGESYKDYTSRLESEQGEAWDRALEAMRDEAIDKLGEFEL